jgi:preprotein translocase subunit SecE
MNASAEVQSSGMDTVKLVLALVMLTAGVSGFYLLEQYSQIIRVLGLLAMVVVAVLIVLQTAVGRNVWKFAADARTEVRKVVWPTRQETIQTTLIVMFVVLLMGIFLWLVDMMLLSIVKTLTGQGG